MKILIAAGGTGGHLFPAERLASELGGENDVFFAGYGLKKGFFGKNYRFYEILSGPLSKFWKIGFGFIQSLWVLIKERPDVVVSFGSYHVFPVVLAAKCLHKRIVLFEANTSLGKVNRFFRKSADAIGMQYPVPGARHVLPFPWKIREEQEEIFRGEKRFTILVFGGSQGAQFLNEIFLEGVPIIDAEFDFRVIHLCGKNGSEKEIKVKYEKMGIHAHVKPFAKNMHALYSISDLAIARAGASTIAELLHYEVPALLIPYPFASEDHQKKNANYFADVGAGFFMEQKMVTANSLVSQVIALKKNLKEHRQAILDYKKKQKDLKKMAFSDLVLEVASR